MQITPEIQQLIDSEVSKREAVLESTYKKHFDNLKGEMLSTLKSYTNEALNQRVNFEAIDDKCESTKYRPIVEGIVGLFKSNGININLNEAASDTSSDLEEARVLLMEATKKIQEMRDMLRLHEMIQTSLTGMSPSVIESALSRFKNDPKFESMTKEDLIKEVAKYVTNMGNKNRTVQMESDSFDMSDLDNIDTILESKVETSDPFTSKFNPQNTFKTTNIKRTVLDEAYGVKKPAVKSTDNSDDPAQEILDLMGM